MAELKPESGVDPEGRKGRWCMEIPASRIPYPQIAALPLRPRFHPRIAGATRHIEQTPKPYRITQSIRTRALTNLTYFFENPVCEFPAVNKGLLFPYLEFFNGPFYNRSVLSDYLQ